MATDKTFDPLYEWLGISPAERPPSHYRLLGLQPLESDPAVIENAADRQMLFLRQLSTGPRGPDAQALLTLVAQAKHVLLDPSKRAAYDASLQSKPPLPSTSLRPIPVRSAPHPPASSMPAPTSTGPPPRTNESNTAATQLLGGSGTVISRRRRPGNASQARSTLRLIAIVLGAPTGILIGLWLANTLLHEKSPVSKQKRGTRPTAQSSKPALKKPLGHNETGSAPKQEHDPVSPEDPPAAPSPNAQPPSYPKVPARGEGDTPVAEASNAFDDFPKSVELPPYTTPDPSALFPIGDSHARLEWSLHSEAADLPGVSSFSLARSTGDPNAWEIVFLPGTTAFTESVPVAKVWSHQGNLLFQWSDTEVEPSVKQQLRNTILEARYGDTSQFIQLRKSIAVSPVVVSFDDEESLSTFELSVPPKADAIILEILTMPSAVAANTKETLHLKKTGAIEYSDLAGARLSTRLLRKGNEDEFTFRVTPEFDEGKLDFELTRARLEEMSKRWREMNQKATLSIKQSQARIAALDAQLDRLRSIDGNLSVITERNRQMINVQGQLKAEIERLPTYRKRLVESELRLKAVPMVEKFFASHSQEVVRFRVFAQAGARQLILAESK